MHAYSPISLSSMQCPGLALDLMEFIKAEHRKFPPPIKAEVTKSYFLLNAKAEGFIVKQKLSLFAEVDNLFDKAYSDLLGTPIPGRWLMGGLKLSLSK